MRRFCLLFLYAALTCSLTAYPADAKIHYSGELNIEGPNFNVDINGDGEVDFAPRWQVLGIGSCGTFWGRYEVLGSKARFLNDDLQFNSRPIPAFPGSKVPLKYGVPIGPQPPAELHWNFSSNEGMVLQYCNTGGPECFCDPVVYGGVWNNVDGYLGIELTIGSNPYYGWIHLRANETNKVWLLGYVYEDTPGTPILAGAVDSPASPTGNSALVPSVMLLFNQ